MKFCQKCWSSNLKHTANSIVCKGCGHSKVTLNVVVNSDVDSGLYGKRLQSFITEKTAPKVKPTLQSSKEDDKWKEYLMLYQKTLRNAAISLINRYHLEREEETILNNLKSVWLGYLTAWREKGTPIRSVFTNPSCYRVKEEESPEDLSEIEERQEEEDEDDLVKRRRPSAYVDTEEILASLEVQNQPQQLKPGDNSKSEIQAHIRSLTSSMTMNTHPYFKKLLSLDLTEHRSVIHLCMKQYVKRLYYLHENRKASNKEKLSLIKHNKVYLKLQWLREAVRSRNQPQFQKMNSESLITYIFMFDTLQCRLGIKSTQNRKTLQQMISKYTQTKKFSNKLINLFINKLRLMTEYNKLYMSSKDEQENIPYLNFNLIYSFVQVALLMSRKVLYPNEIVEETLLSVEGWEDTDYLKVNSKPKTQSVRANSIFLLNSIKLNTVQSNRYLWIDRLCEEIGIQEYRSHILVLAKTLIVDSDWLINEDVECLAVIAIFVKMMVNMDGQTFLTLMDLEGIRVRHRLEENTLYKQVLEYQNKIGEELQELKERTMLRLPEIIKNIRESNKRIIKRRKLESLVDLRSLTSTGILAIKKTDLHLFRASSEHLKLKEIFNGTQPHSLKPPPTLRVQLTVQLSTKHVQLKTHLINEVPTAVSSEQKVLKKDVGLPCGVYEILSDFRSNYECLEKQEYMQLLGNLSECRCSIDQLYIKVEQLEKQLIIFQDQ